VGGWCLNNPKCEKEKNEKKKMKNEKISTGVWTGVPSFDPFSFQWSVRYSLGESSIIKMIDFGSRRKSLLLLLNIIRQGSTFK